MNYTESDASVVHVGTGNRMHQSSAPVTTEVSAQDMNMLIWSMMEVVKAAGLSGATFDADVPGSYRRFLTAFNGVDSALQGAGLGGFSGRLNYVGLTIGARLLDLGASPRSLGGTGDGVADDTQYIKDALLYSKTVDLRNRQWRITSTVDLPSGCVLDLRGGAIVADTGSAPVFRFSAGKEGLLICGGGAPGEAGQVRGTAGDFLLCEGSRDTPTVVGHYARQIRVENLHCTSETIGRFATFSKACRQVYLRGLMLYTQSGIFLNGKVVEFELAGSILFSSSGQAGTFGIKTRSTGGGSFYNEGISILNCTVDNFEIGHDVTDVFTYQVVGGYHGVSAALAATTGYAFQFSPPVGSTHCEEIEVSGGVVIAGRTRFVASAVGRSYHAKIDAHVIGTPGTAVAIENNASDIDVNVVCKAGTGVAVGVVGTNNNARVSARGKFDATYVNGVVLNGPVGDDCVIGPVSGPTSGDIVGAGRPVLLVGVPIHSTQLAYLVRGVSPNNLAGSYPVGSTVGSVSWSFVRGERGDIVISVPYSGANAALQNLQVSVPPGVTLESGVGWAANNLFLGAANGMLFARIPYWCSSNGSGLFSVVNQAGNTLTVLNQAYIGITKDL